MDDTLSPFSQWALDPARTAEEKYLIFLLCDDCNLLAFHRLPEDKKDYRRLKHADYRLRKKLYLSPLMMPKCGVEDTEQAAAMAPYVKRFAPGLEYECRRIGDAGAVFRFFPALEEVILGTCDLQDLSFVEALPLLKTLQLNSALLKDLRPLAKCAALRDLSLGFRGAQHPCLIPPLYWVDASPLGELTQLESLTIHPNAAILSGLRFPSLKSAEFGGENCVQRDCSYLPEMPALRMLKLEGPQSLRGIGRFPELRNLRLAGPLRDFEEIAELKHLTCLDVQTLHGWPTDVTPLTGLPELLWVNFRADLPRNYWPLTNAPKLCEVELEVPILQVSSVALDVQAINAVLRPWDDVFHLPELRPRGRLGFVAVDAGGDTSVLPRISELPIPDQVADPRLFRMEVMWMQRRAFAVLKKFGGIADSEEAGKHKYHLSRDYIPTDRSFSVTIQTISAAQQLPQLLEALRELMAASPHPWICQVALCLRITPMDLTEQQKKWLAGIDKESRRWEDERDHERWSKTQQHIVETQFRLRTSREEGEEVNPEDFEPPEEIRVESYLPEPVYADIDSAGDDADEEENPDFALKTFDEQEKDSGDDDDGDDSNVKTTPDPDPPPDFLEDPYAHPLADSYRFYAQLTFDKFYFHGRNLATVQQLMGRGPDEYYPAPEKKK